MGLSFFPCLPEKFCLHCHRFYVLVKFNPVQSVATSVAISFCLSGSTPGHHLWALSNGLTHIFFTHNYSRSASQPANERATLPPLNGLDYCKRNQNLNVEELWHCIVCLNKWYYHNQEMLYSGHQSQCKLNTATVYCNSWGGRWSTSKQSSEMCKHPGT